MYKKYWFPAIYGVVVVGVLVVNILWTKPRSIGIAADAAILALFLLGVARRRALSRKNGSKV